MTLLPRGEWRLHLYTTILTLIILAVAPFFLSVYYVRLLAVGMLFGLAATGLNVLFGYTGLLSFGHAAFWGVGAYAVAIAMLKLRLGFIEAFLLALASTFTVALVIGYLSLRHTRIYFAMLTLAFAQLLYALALKLRSLTGGDEGLYGIPRPLDSIESYYYLVFGVTAVTLILILWILGSPLGLAFQAVRDNPSRAETLGYSVRRIRLTSFILSGMVTGVAGALYAPLQGAITPESLYWTFSAELVFMAILGGTSVFLGPLVGGVAFIFLRNYAMAITEYWLFLVGMALATLILALPGGILGTIMRVVMRLGSTSGG